MIYSFSNNMKKIHLLLKAIVYSFYLKPKFLQTLLLVVFLNHSMLKAEVQNELPRTINYPSRSDWTFYFSTNLKSIEAKLYKAAVDGTIKSYFNDSFTGLLTRDELLKPQAALLLALPGTQDVDAVNASKNIEVIKGLRFIQTIESTPFEFNQKQELTGVTLTIEFFHMEIPFVYIRTADLKTVLNENELTFLKLLAYHSTSGNGRWVRSGLDFKNEDFFFTLHFNGYNQYMADTTLFEKLATTLYTTSDFIKMTAIYHKDDLLFMDIQTGKPISHQGIIDSYNNTYNFFAEIEGYPVHSITVAKNNVPQFNILFPVDKNLGSLTEVKFSLPFKALEELGLMKVNTWFFTDYLRWKL